MIAKNPARHLAPDRTIARAIRDHLGCDTQDYETRFDIQTLGLMVRVLDKTWKLSREDYETLQHQPWNRDVLERIML